MIFKICIPCYSDFGTLKPLLKVLVKSQVHSFPVVTGFVDCFPDNSRNEAVIESDLQFPALPAVDGFLFMDTDMLPTANQIYALAKHLKRDDVDIVGALYPKNGPVKGYCVSIKGGPSETVKSKGMHEVQMVGFGCAFVKRHVLTKLPKPWFETVWSKGEVDGVKKFRLIHEDIVFCLKAIKAGFKVWCDFDIEVEHQVRKLKDLQERMRL